MASGYPDGQRVQQQQNLSLAYSLTTQQVGPKASGVLYAGNYGYVSASVIVAGNPVLAKLSWFADKSLSTGFGVSEVGLDPNINTAGFWCIPIEGPYFVVTVDPGGGGIAYTPITYFYLTNSPRANVLTDPGRFAYNLLTTLAAGAASVFNAAGYMSGRVGVYSAGGSQGTKFRLDALDPVTLTWQQVNLWTLAGNAADYREIILPATASRLTVTNSSATTQSTNVAFNAWQLN